MQPKLVRIDGVIGTAEGEVSAQMVREQLPANGTDPIKVELHSEGGAVFEGFAIHDVCAAYEGPKTLSIQSSAFSIASFIAMAFDDVEISSNGYMMLHNPYSRAEGDDEDLANQAQMLGQLKDTMVTAYSQRSGRPEEEIRAILKNETYLNAQQCVEMGLVSRVSGQPIIGRAFAKTNDMPHGVVAALFGAGSGGDNDSTKGKTMPESKPVAATLDEIEAAFPKAKADFIVNCLRKAMPMASVASAAVEEMMTENEALKAQVAAMQEELTAARAMTEEPDAMEEDPAAEGDEVIEDDPAAMEDEEEKPAARSRGVRPVAKSKTSSPSASVRWNEAVESCIPKCKGDKMRAVAMANRNNPGLRDAYVAEVNARR